MKQFLPAVFLIICSNVFAQSYSTFHKNRPAYYQFNSYDVFYQQAAVAIDSFDVSGSDTIFFQSPIIDYDNGNGCYIKAHDTSFVGASSIRNNNGDDFFFNKSNDSIYFNNSSSLNQSWTMHRFTNGDVIKATVQSIDEVSVLGVDDSVKTIKLQVQDSIGNNINNIFNGKIFRVGKSTGFVNGYSLFHFPFDTIAFSLVGIENPSLGLSSENLTPEKIFDFDVGDRFDFSHDQGFEPISHSSFRETDSILLKTISPDGDTITYQVGFINWNFGNYMYDIWDTVVSGLKQWEFILSSHNFLLNRSYQYFDGGYENDYHFLVEAFYNSSLPVLQNQPDYFIPGGNDCLNWLVADDYYNDFYGAGLGKVMSYYGNWGMNGWMYESLVYYNKNGVEWGDSIKWSVITEVNNFDKKSIRIFPNPAHSQLFLSGNFSPSQTNFILLNALGEEMKLNQLSNQFGSVSFDVHSLPPGCYVLQVSDENHIQNLKFIKS
ncbi:MAG TPA: T9SS type A sorting domain-containing protein [Chitinophagales bacterium]|nr:T9SS type A sorting domain-containing protein [Chitinophagales bacterium]